MPISATGNSRSGTARDAGFSLVELLAVLAIMSLMVGAVVVNLPGRESALIRESALTEAKVARFLDDGAVAGEMRALGVSRTGLTLYAHDGLIWQAAEQLPWPDGARASMRRGRTTVKLADEPAPTLLFEPYGDVPDFEIALRGRDAVVSLSVDERGQVIRTVDR